MWWILTDWWAITRRASRVDLEVHEWGDDHRFPPWSHLEDDYRLVITRGTVVAEMRSERASSFGGKEASSSTARLACHPKSARGPACPLLPPQLSFVLAS